MIEGVVVCPSPLMLLPEYVGLEDPAGPLRERCVEVLRTALQDRHSGGAGWDSVVVLTGRDPVSRSHKDPVGVRVGRLLLGLAGWQGPVEELVVPFDADANLVEREGLRLSEHAGHPLVLVIADGSARRSEKAPGHLDERAFAVDEALLRALDDVDPGALLSVDAIVASEVLASGRAALQVMAHAVRRTPRLSGGLLWSGDPYGVMYAVATWEARA